MRSLTLTALFFALAASPAWAIGGHGNGGGNGNFTTTTLKVVNDCDQAVVVSANGTPHITLEPNGSQDIPIITAKGSRTILVTLTATIEGTLISDTETASIKAGNRATATITAPASTSLSIAFSGHGLAKVAMNRDASVMLASTGGLLPLLWLSCLFGRAPRRRDHVADSAERTSDAI